MRYRKQSHFGFRIIAGNLKGRLIRTPDLGTTRPPLTRLRKAIFDFLNPYLEQCRYLDLFSGTGSYLFEAVSRGARTAYGVEIEPGLAEAINDQARKLGVEDRLVCWRLDVFEAIPRFQRQEKRFDLIMVAPPQYKGIIDRTLRVMRTHEVLNRGGMILCQHDSSETGKTDFLDFKLVQRRKYGNTTFTVLRDSS